MATSTKQASHAEKRPVSRASIIVAFAAVYFFWGSTYTAIRIGSADMPALLFAGMRFLIAGLILMGWCRFRGLRIYWPRREMTIFCAVGLLLLGGGNVGLVYAERTMPSGLSSLVLAVILGILVLGERPEVAEFVGMAGVIVAVYLSTSARMGRGAERASE